MWDNLELELTLMLALWPSELSVVIACSIFFPLFALLGYRVYKINANE